jgi:hypothetical protein
MGIHVTSVMSVFALGSLLALLQWRSSGRRRWLLVAGLLLGLGLWAKVLFLWWIVALALWSAANSFVAEPRQQHMGGERTRMNTESDADGHRSSRKSASISGVFSANPRSLLPVGAGILIGSAPLWLYNLMTGGTLIALSRNVVQTEHGVSNLNVIHNLAAAVESFVVLLDGRYFWFQGGQFANHLNVVGFAAAIAAAIVLVRMRPEWRKGLFLIGLLIAVIVAESAFTVSGIWATHLYILLPLPQMAAALGIVLVADWLGQRLRWARAIVIVGALAAGMAANYQVDVSYHAALERSRGLSRFSDAIYELSTWLDERQFGIVYACDWGIQKNVQILTQGRVNPIEIAGFAGEPEEAFVRRAEQALATPNAVYVFHSTEDTVYVLYPAFKATADRLRVRLRIIEATRDHSGAPVHVIWMKE